MPAPGGFTYSRAVREWAFVQVPLVSLSDFRKAAGERGLMKVSPLDASRWETLDREDLLPPVAYSLHGFWHDDDQGYLDNGDLIVREERGFVPWDGLPVVPEQECMLSGPSPADRLSSQAGFQAPSVQTAAGLPWPWLVPVRSARHVPHGHTLGQTSARIGPYASLALRAAESKQRSARPLIVRTAPPAMAQL